MLAALLLCASMPASAQVSDGKWWAAEGPHFKVLSSGSREDAEDMVIKLERLDQALRMFRGIAATTAPYPETAKPTVFQFGEARDVGRLVGSESVLGFFIPRAGQSVAFVPLKADRSVDRAGAPGTRESYEFYDHRVAPHEVLFHEYTHYFMFQHAPAAYPSWYVEGFAELFGMIRLTDTGFDLGEAPESRKGTIETFAVEYENLFDPPKDRRSVVVDYAQGWLATSYLTFEPSRKGQLAKYLSLVNQGKPNKEAAQEAFGDLKKLERELNAYRRQRARGVSVSFPSQSKPPITVRALGADENARMDMMMRAKAGVTKAQARSLTASARKLVETYPNSVPVLLAATESEFDAGELANADALAQRALAIDPKAIDAMLFRASVALEYAKKDPAYIAQARAHFIAANRLNNDHPVALQGYYRTFVLAGQTPPKDALIALEAAFSAAPFDANIRRDLAYLLLTENRDREALLVLGPIVNSPHVEKSLRDLREAITKLEAGDRQPLIDELKPKLEEDEKKKA